VRWCAPSILGRSNVSRESLVRECTLLVGIELSAGSHQPRASHPRYVRGDGGFDRPIPRREAAFPDERIERVEQPRIERSA
jgi:hypothetical protein